MAPSSCSQGIRRGAWSKEEDVLLQRCVEKYGEGNWHLVPSRSGLRRCRKSCRLRWLNYLSPKIKRGHFSHDEVDLIIRMQKLLGNRWSLIAGRLPGRTANDVKNFWNIHLNKKMTSQPAVRDETPSPSVVVPIKPQARRFTTMIPHFGTFSPSLISSPKPQPSKNPPKNASLIDHSSMMLGHQLFPNQSQENSWLHELLNLVSDGEDFISIDEPDFEWGDLMMDSQLWASFNNGSSWLT